MNKHFRELTLMLFLLCGIVTISCNRKELDGIDAYNQMYADSFDILIEGIGDVPSLNDTLYTKMYIALKTCSNERTHAVSNEVCDTFYALYNTLREKGTSDKWFYECTEMKSLVLSLQRRLDEYKETRREMYYLFPVDNWERASYLGVEYHTLGMEDSAKYYLELCVRLCDSIIINSNDSEERQSAIVNKWSSLALLGKDYETREFIDSMLRKETDPKIKELLLEISSEKDAEKQLREGILQMNEAMYK